ncbi:sensor histidine kinase [Loktanella salsilacus]|uniref:sensor histidine kinase n=1 Tax=Loktanella salsilacus TaxID=195913 RepID=UPI003734C930
MTSGSEVQGERWPFLQSLPFRVVAFLSLALLPIGLLAIWQTQNLDETLQARTRLSLVALTEIAVSGERQVLQRAVGAASGQAVTYGLTADDPIVCSESFKAFQDADPAISFAGFLPPSGRVDCSSEPEPFSIGPSERVANIATSPLTTLIPRLRADAPGGRTAVLTQPVVRGDDVIGQIVLTILTESMSQMPDLNDQNQPLSLAIFNRDGKVITVQGEAHVPAEEAIAEDIVRRLGPEPTAFAGQNAQGERRIFVVLTLVPDLAYAVAGWAPTDGVLSSTAYTLPSFFLPALMWLASLLVAYFAVHRLVVSPVQDLGSRMRRFASDRALPQPKNTEMLPQELFDLEQTFINMAYDLIDDEARMENSLREKNVLLKEIHHRVKNNLQMISSIMNMQIRAAKTDESRHALRRLQDRVLGLATVHRVLYQSKELSRADAAPLMTDICASVFNELAEARPHAVHALEVDNFTLVPDQAVPLALLVSEVGSNAIKNLPDTASPAPFLNFSLRIVSPGMAQFRCRNSGGSLIDKVAPDGGVGRQLIRAFATQLGGTVEVQDRDGIHTISVEFPITTAIPDALDY